MLILTDKLAADLTHAVRTDATLDELSLTYTLIDLTIVPVGTDVDAWLDTDHPDANAARGIAEMCEYYGLATKHLTMLECDLLDLYVDGRGDDRFPYRHENLTADECERLALALEHCQY